MAKNISKGQELRELKAEDLDKKLVEAKEELFNLRFQSATGQLESHGRLSTVRREIARIYTVMRERELGISDVKAAEADEAESDENAQQADKAGKQTEGAA